MTLGAVRRESRRYMIRIGETRIFDLMARVTVGRRARELACDVAVDTWHRDMRAG